MSSALGEWPPGAARWIEAWRGGPAASARAARRRGRRATRAQAARRRAGGRASTGFQGARHPILAAPCPGAAPESSPPARDARGRRWRPRPRSPQHCSFRWPAAASGSPGAVDRGGRVSGAASPSRSCARARRRATRRCSRSRCGRSRWSTSSPTTIRSGLRRRLRVRYPIRADRAIGRGRPAQRPPPAGAVAAREGGRLDRVLAMVHWAGSSSRTWRCLDPRPPTTGGSRAPPGRWPPPTTSAARSTSPCPRRRPGGRPRTGDDTAGERGRAG